MRTDLFQDLITLLKKVPENRFSMEHWASGKLCGKPIEEFHTQCNTTLCIGGWATTLESFKKEGLKLESSDSDLDNWLIVVRNDHVCHFGSWALAKVLDITVNDAYRLFVASSATKRITNKNEAIQMLEHYVKTGEVEYTF
jgi:hypothetical protein